VSMDIGFLLDNPRWSETITVKRRTVTVNDWGEGITNVVPRTISAIVTPTGGKEVGITPEAERLSDSITIYTREPLLLANATTGGDEDIVVYHGQEWHATGGQDWGNFGYYITIAEQTDAGGRDAS
jgi:hypothetical protein